MPAPDGGPNIVVFVQARTGSTRLPGKILKTVLGKELLIHQVERIRKAATVNRVVVITTTKPEDDPVTALCGANGVDVYRGSETDLLDRHYRAARAFGADFIVKIPSDCPLADPRIIDEVIGLWVDHPDAYDYVSNYHAPTFPDGLDVEGCPFGILEVAWKEAAKPFEREHTFPFIWDNPGRFRIGNVTNPRGDMFMSHRWTLDYPEDYLFLKAVIEALAANPDFGMDDVLELLNRRPDLAEINAKYNGVNWYRHVDGQLKTVDRTQYRNETE